MFLKLEWDVVTAITFLFGILACSNNYEVKSRAGTALVILVIAMIFIPAIGVAASLTGVQLP